MEKRGQITTFIIVGMVLLVAVLFFIFVSGIVSEPSGGPGVPDGTAVKIFTETCMQGIVEDGADILLGGGGYIDAESIYPDLLFKSDSYVKMPYRLLLWNYRGQDRMPTRRDMESQLELYLEEALDDCLDDYSQFKDHLSITEHGDREATIAINREEIVATLASTLEIRDLQDIKEETIDGFSSSTSSMLGKLYALSEGIMDEVDKGMLEYITDDIIASSPKYPYEGMEFSCGPKRWSIAHLREEFRLAIQPNLLMIHFENTHFVPTGDPYYDKLFVFPAGEEDFSDVSVDLNYDTSWRLTFDVHPKRGHYTYPIEVEPESNSPIEFLTSAIMGVCIKLQHHKYSVTYPILFRLRDIDAGQTFYFAVPVMMKNNLPNRDGSVQDFITQIDLEGSKEFCSDTVVVTDYGLDPVTDRMISNGPIEIPRTKRDINVYAEDQHSGEMIPYVPVLYQCVKFLCEENGNTTYPLENGVWYGGDPFLAGRFPDCTGALFRADHPDFLTGQVQLDVDESTSGENVVVPIYALKTFEYGFKVVNLDGTLRELRDTEEILLSLTIEDMGFDESIFYPIDLEAFSKLQLLYGNHTYALQIILLEDGRATGGSEISWNPKKERIDVRNYILFFPVEYGDMEVIDPDSPEWQMFLARSKANKPGLI